MSDRDLDQHLSVRIFTIVRERGPLTFTQIVRATQTNRGTVWRLLKLLQEHGQIRTVALHGRIHYVVRSR